MRARFSVVVVFHFQDAKIPTLLQIPPLRYKAFRNIFLKVVGKNQYQMHSLLC